MSEGDGQLQYCEGQKESRTIFKGIICLVENTVNEEKKGERESQIE